MKKKRNLLALFLAVLIVCCTVLTMFAPASAVTLKDATIDPDAKGSITIHKYDTTAASKPKEQGGVSWTEDMFLSDGKANEEAEETLANYAIEGAGFAAIKVGEVQEYAVQRGANNAIQNVWGVTSARLLSALNLDEYNIHAVTSISNINYYMSDALQNALSNQLTSNARATKDTLEAIVKGGDNIVFPLTDAYGVTKVDNLPVGLYLICEVKAPQNVTTTVAPMLVSIPTTDSYAADADGNVIGGNRWMYEVEMYPKDLSGIPSLEKEVEDNAHGLSYGTAEQGFSDVATVSDGDALTYRILSRIPTVSSTATYLTQYKLVDTMSKGVSYNQRDIKIAWYSSQEDAAGDYTTATANNPAAVHGSHAIATWNYGSDYFAVSYGTNGDGQETMTVNLTEKGLKEINQPVSSDAQFGKYSDCTMVVYYGATVHANDTVIYGDNGNPNDVTLTWSRTSDPETYYDTLKDRSMVYVYGVDLTKEFSDGGRKYDNVEFVLENTSNVTGKLFVVAAETEDISVTHSGKYYVTGFTAKESDATRLIPNSSTGRLLVYGLEEDTYVLTETKTASGYTLLRDSITLDIDTDYTPGTPEEKGLCCGKLSAKATVDGTAVNMAGDNDSPNALIPLKVMNTRGFDLPKTGGTGTLATTICGVLVLAGIIAFAAATRKGKRG